MHLPFLPTLINRSWPTDRLIKEGENVKNNFAGSETNIIINCNVLLSAVDVDEPVYVGVCGQKMGEIAEQHRMQKVNTSY